MPMNYCKNLSQYSVSPPQQVVSLNHLSQCFLHQWLKWFGMMSSEPLYGMLIPTVVFAGYVQFQE